MEDIEYIGSRSSITCTGAAIPFIPFEVDTRPPHVMRVYLSASQLQPTTDIGVVGDLYIRCVYSLYGSSSVEIYWKGFRKNRIKTVWREVLTNSAEIQHPLYPNLYLHGTPECNWWPEWREKNPQGQGQGNIKESAGNFVKIFDTGGVANPINLS